jgi:hypothetical protein
MALAASARPYVSRQQNAAVVPAVIALSELFIKVLDQAGNPWMSAAYTLTTIIEQLLLALKLFVVI